MLPLTFTNNIKVLGKGNKERIIPFSAQLKTALKYIYNATKTLRPFLSFLIVSDWVKNKSAESLCHINFVEADYHC